MALCLSSLSKTWPLPRLPQSVSVSQGKAGVSGGRWVPAVDDEVQIKSWDRREGGNLSPTWIQPNCI